MDPTPGTACWTQDTGLPDASLLTLFETMQKERIQDPYIFALYLQPLSMRPNCVISLIPHWGRHSS